MQWLILGGLLVANQLGTTLLLAGIILYSITTIFAFVTLPVEVDASRRAVLWLEGAGIVDDRTKPMVKDALHAAAYTYVVAALGSLGTLLYYIMIFMGRRD
jgi:Zn-dependent membrane protease YugP